MKTRDFTILHSNDMHGDFIAEVCSEGTGKLVGGLSLLSGYINKVRREEENVFYVVSGDMLQGSLIDTEYKGLSTIELMNYLAPDVVTLGNHEIDYGLAHLLFLEKLANFPIVNANLYIKKYNKRLMRPYIILNVAGFDVLFIGIITEKIIDALRMESLIGSFVSVEEAAHEVGIICDTYKNDDIDLTILLTHIGYESDLELASLLDPEWGVDMIIGGHTHTILEEPTKVNDVLIAQAGVGTNQIGRFDIVVDDDTNSIVEYDWELVQINEKTSERDEKLCEFIDSFKEEVDRKYNTIVTKLAVEATHPEREIETSLGNLIADALASIAECDIMLLGSGSVRVKALGPVVTLKDLISCFPYNDSLSRYTISGEKLYQLFNHVMRIENRDGEGECYQVNEGVEVKYSDKKKTVTSLKIAGQKVDKDRNYTIALQGFHYANSKEYLSVSNEEFLEGGPSRVISTSTQDALEEYLRTHQNLKPEVEGRLVYSKN